VQDRKIRCSRRKFLAQAAALTLSTGLTEPAAGDATSADLFRARPPKLTTQGRKPIACIASVYRPMSHAYHIAGRFILGYPRDGRLHVPQQYISALSVDQLPDNDLAREIGREHGIRVDHKSIADALTNGGNKLAVEGVLLICEHGNYPRNDKDQTLYPRYEMMEQIVSVFRKTGQSVPVFNDKHLSYSWSKAKQIVAWSRELNFPLMAGSSLPVTWRRPELELPVGTPIDEALVAAYGPLESYGFHALETLQCHVERRKGGETGIKAVTCLRGKEVWKAGDAGRWSWELLEAALGRSETLNPGDVRKNVGLPVQGRTAAAPAAFLVEYRDGLRGAVLMLNGHVQDFTFAARVKGEVKPVSSLHYLPAPPGAKNFDCLTANIEKLFTTRKSPYPIERTLLTSGILDFALESNYRKGARIETPDLEVSYSAPEDSGFFRGNVAAPV
jgi:hypothetical protein